MEPSFVDNKQAKSPVWKYFGVKVVDGKQAKGTAVCKTCLAEIKTGGGTSNLLNHLKRHHAMLHSECTRPTGEKPKETKAESEKKPVQQSLQNMLQSKLPPNSARATQITEKIATFIIKGLEPFSIVERPDFRDMITTLDPR